MPKFLKNLATIIALPVVLMVVYFWMIGEVEAWVWRTLSYGFFTLGCICVVNQCLPKSLSLSKFKSALAGDSAFGMAVYGLVFGALWLSLFMMLNTLLEIRLFFMVLFVALVLASSLHDMTSRVGKWFTVGFLVSLVFCAVEVFLLVLLEPYRLERLKMYFGF